MSFFKKLSGLFSAPRQSPSEALWIEVRCNRCGEIIRSRVDLHNDLSAEYDEAGGMTYICRKQLVGEGAGELPCFQRVDVELIFDASRRLTGREISGGQFVESSILR